MANRSSKHAQPKRHGNHQKRSGHFLKVYHPYLPLLALAFVVLGVVGLVRSQANEQTTQTQQTSQATGSSGSAQQGSSSDVLAYATAISSDGLLAATNQRRATAGANNLSINAQLTQAAQAKANDMASRNYWAHNTPDGTPPWAFITNAGYSYSRAGENLACGFNESAEVVTGWYNSPSHKDNLLHTGYQHVGFGITNAPNYNCGNFPADQQTIIVAMYASPYTTPSAQPATPAPQTRPAATQPSVSAPAASPTPPAQPVDKHTVTLTVTDTKGKPAPGIKVTLHSEPRTAMTDGNGVVIFNDVETGKHKAVVEIEGAKTETDIDLTNAPKEYKLTLLKPILASNKIDLGAEPQQVMVESKTVSRLALFTGKNVGWTMFVLTLLTLAGAGYLLVKHSIAAHRFFIKGEQYILKHKVVDVVVIALAILLFVVTRNVGAIL